MKEKIDTAIIQPIKLPKLKGHTKIILTDVRTGKEKIIEKDNMVTNAVARIFANNFGNSLDVTDEALTPIRNLFGGVMCFKQQLVENANNIFPPIQTANELIAHAGDDESVSHDNLKWGALNKQESGVLSRDGVPIGYKWVWEWATSQGNGTINACGLTSANGGNIGLTPVDASLPHTICKNFDHITTGYTTGSKSASNIIYLPIRYDRSKNRAYAAFIDVTSTSTGVNTFTEYELEHHALKFGINSAAINHDASSSAWEIRKTRTVSLTSNFTTKHAIMTDGTDYYVFQRTSATTIQGCKVTTGGTDLVATALNISVSGANFGDLPFPASNNTWSYRFGGRYGNIPIHNGYAYFPTADETGFYKVNLANQSDSTLLTSYCTDIHCYEPAYWAGDICCGYNFIINGDSIYPAKISNGRTFSQSGIFYDQLAFSDTPSLLAYTQSGDTGATSHLGKQWTNIFSMYLATINNLESEIEKTPAQTMKIVYSLEEVQEV